MKFAFLYEIGDSPERRDVRDFPDLDAAKAHAHESIRSTLAASSAESGSICIGEVEGDEEHEVYWLGSFDLERDAEPVWSAD